MATNVPPRQRHIVMCLSLAACASLGGAACSEGDAGSAGSGGSVVLTGGASGTGATAGSGGSVAAGAGGQAGGAGAAGAGGQAAGAGGAAGGGGAAGLSFDGPQLLSETGLYTAIQDEALSPDVMPYEVQYPLWSDGSAKRRYLSLPPGARIDTTSMDDWVLPVGTTAWKEFERDGVRVETRMLRRLAQGWQFVAYVWRDDLSDADAAPQGVVDARGTSHDVPSQEQCLECHRTADSGPELGVRFIGLSALQLSQPGGGALAALASGDRLTQAPGREFSAPGDADTASALGYLHGNCGYCHSSGHPVGAWVSMQLGLATGDQSLEDTGFYSTTIARQTSHVIAGTSVRVQPGEPEASQLYVRMGIRDLEQMPPLGTELVDAAGRSAVERLILALPRN